MPVGGTVTSFAKRHKRNQEEAARTLGKKKCLRFFNVSTDITDVSWTNYINVVNLGSPRTNLPYKDGSVVMSGAGPLSTRTAAAVTHVGPRGQGRMISQFTVTK